MSKKQISWHVEFKYRKTTVAMDLKEIYIYGFTFGSWERSNYLSVVVNLKGGVISYSSNSGLGKDMLKVYGKYQCINERNVNNKSAHKNQ